ncbi:MAG: VOC family protein [Pseudomonadota bacterium]
MIDGFSQLQIDVPNVDAAVNEYSALLGRTAPDGSQWSLANIALRLAPTTAETAKISRLSLWSKDDTDLPEETLGLSLAVTSKRDVSSTTSEDIFAVDHLVLRTTSADDCIALFGDRLGMRLALDQQVPEWGGRMLFFRCGKLTLEVIQSLDNPIEQDHFWGITYLCGNLSKTLARLDCEGVMHSGPREGRKPGTRVATVKSHSLGIPTLLIEPASSESAAKQSRPASSKR